MLQVIVLTTALDLIKLRVDRTAYPLLACLGHAWEKVGSFNVERALNTIAQLGCFLLGWHFLNLFVSVILRDCFQLLDFSYLGQTALYLRQFSCLLLPFLLCCVTHCKLLHWTQLLVLFVRLGLALAFHYVSVWRKCNWAQLLWHCCLLLFQAVESHLSFWRETLASVNHYRQYSTLGITIIFITIALCLARGDITELITYWVALR